MADKDPRPSPAPAPLLLELPGLQQNPALAAVLAALLEADELGHTGITLGDVSARASQTPEQLGTLLTQQLASAGIVSDRPLVLLEDWITSRRTWQHEHALAQDLIIRAAARRMDDIDRESEVDLQRWFPREVAGNELQRLAVATALARGLSVITGGPGRGKTHVAGALVAIGAAAQLRQGRKPLQVCLSAPTGKASARLRSAIVLALDREVQAGRMTASQAAGLARWSTTLHRLFHDRSKADIDLLIIDEVSMVSAATLHRALHGIPSTARVVLLGDADQLFSVDPGRVLADLAAYGHGAVDAPLAHWYGRHWPLPEQTTASSTAHPLDCAQVRLLVNHRSAGTPVATLADACQAQAAGSVQAFESLLDRGETAIVDHHGAWAVRCDPPPPAQFAREFFIHAADHVARLVHADEPSAALRIQASWLILAALRRGPYGAEALTRAFEELLAIKDVVTPDASGHYRGRPVLVTSNHPELELSNGDLGVLWPQADGLQWDLVIDGGASLHRVALQRISNWQPAWIMTVHKSQGSQAAQVDVLGPGPERASHPLLTRELLYTAITRARERVRLWMSMPQLLSAVDQRTQRVSGFSRALQLASAASLTSHQATPIG